MTFDWEIWSTPLMVLGAGVVLGVALLMRQNQSVDTVVAEGERRDLEREHQAALEALRALETEREKMEAADYERERQALLSRGAAAMRALEGAGGAAAAGASGSDDLSALVAVLKAERERVGAQSFDAALRVATGHGAPAEPERDAMSPTWRGALTASAVWALVALLVVFAGDQSTVRRDGGSMTGGTTSMGGPPQAPPMAPPNAPDFEAMAEPLKKRVEANPQDIEAWNELTQLALSSGDAQGAMQYNQSAAAIDPDDPDVGASKAVLAAMVGLAPRALSILEDVLAKHPRHVRSLTYKGLLLLEEGQHEAAVPVLELVVELQPGVVPLQQALDAARRGEGLPGMGQAPAPAPAAAGGGDVVMSGTIHLKPGAKTDGAQVLFLSVRSPEGGPPLAAKRLPVGEFPVRFEITTADAISMGGAPRPFPATMSLNARLDADGNAMTKEDLASAGAGGVAKGATGLELTLD